MAARTTHRAIRLLVCAYRCSCLDLCSFLPLATTCGRLTEDGCLIAPRQFDHPPEGFVFRDPAHIMLAVKVSHCHVPDCGRVDLILNPGKMRSF